MLPEISEASYVAAGFGSGGLSKTNKNHRFGSTALHVPVYPKRIDIGCFSTLHSLEHKKAIWLSRKLSNRPKLEAEMERLEGLGWRSGPLKWQQTKMDSSML